MNKKVVRSSLYILGPKSLQNTLLVEYLAARLENCFDKQLIEDSGTAFFEMQHARESCDQVLLFVDADGIDASEIHSLLVESSTHTNTRLVFFNVSFGEVLYALNQSPLVHGVFQKQTPPGQFTRGIHTILRGEAWKPTQAATSIHLSKSRSDVRQDADLTNRELEIIELLTTGAKNREIAEKLFVSTHTVKTHIYHIYKKINVENRLQAVNWANRHLF